MGFATARKRCDSGAPALTDREPNAVFRAPVSPEAYLYYNTSTEAVPSFQVASKRRKNTTAAHFLDVPHSLSQSGCAVMLAGAEPWPTVPSWRTTELLVASALVRDANLPLFYATAHTEQKSRHTASGWLSQHDHAPFRVAGRLAFLADLGVSAAADWHVRDAGALGTFCSTDLASDCDMWSVAHNTCRDGDRQRE